MWTLVASLLQPLFSLLARLVGPVAGWWAGRRGQQAADERALVEQAIAAARVEAGVAGAATDDLRRRLQRDAAPE